MLRRRLAGCIQCARLRHEAIAHSSGAPQPRCEAHTLCVLNVASSFLEEIFHKNNKGHVLFYLVLEKEHVLALPTLMDT